MNFHFYLSYKGIENRKQQVSKITCSSFLGPWKKRSWSPRATTLSSLLEESAPMPTIHHELQTHSQLFCCFMYLANKEQCDSTRSAAVITLQRLVLGRLLLPYSFLNFYCYSITVVCLFSPSPYFDQMDSEKYYFCESHTFALPDDLWNSTVKFKNINYDFDWGFSKFINYCGNKQVYKMQTFSSAPYRLLHFFKFSGSFQYSFIAFFMQLSNIYY